MVLPAFNAEGTIARAVGSVIGQTSPPQEIIVVDDGSTDSTGEIVATFGSAVRCIRQENAGAAAARNRGIAAATGELIAFLDADDEWLPRHLELATGVLAAHPQLRWYSARYEKRGRHGSVLRSDADPVPLVGGAYFPDYFEAARTWTNFTPTMLIDRRVFSEVGVFDEGLRTAEDLDLWFRIALSHPQIGYGREITVIIWETPGSLVTQGLFDARAARRFVEKCEREAASLRRPDEPALRAFLVKWMLHFMRQSLRRGDRDALSWVAHHFGREIPLAWRLLSVACRATPRLLWSGGMRVWESARPLRRRD